MRKIVTLFVIVSAALLGACATTSTVPATSPAFLRDCDGCAELAIIPAGRFTMGTDLDSDSMRAEGPAHEVRIAKPFAMARTEVTIAQFRRFVAATGYQVAGGCRVQERQLGPRGRIEWHDDPQSSWQQPGLAKPQTDNEPVVCVGRVDGLAYAAWLATTTGKPYRLPSESEWEYAARGGSAGTYPWGSNADNGCQFANLYDKSGRAASDFGWGYVDCDDGYAELAPVGHYKPNNFGLYDVIGNVWEWTADCYREKYEPATQRDGHAVPGDATCANWSVRGGGYMTRPSRQRLTYRGRDPNNAHYSYFGFRVARDLQPGELPKAARR